MANEPSRPPRKSDRGFIKFLGVGLWVILIAAVICVVGVVVLSFTR